MLNDLGLIPDDTVLNVPLVNHSHVIDGKNFGSIWWRIEVVLVTDPAMWPDVNGDEGHHLGHGDEQGDRAGKAIGPVDCELLPPFRLARASISTEFLRPNDAIGRTVRTFRTNGAPIGVALLVARGAGSPPTVKRVP